jgi:AraC-like DNA-binding protein
MVIGAHPRLSGWAGTVVLASARLVYVGPGSLAARHAHHAIQICVAGAGTLRLRERPNAAWRRMSSAVIPSDEPHELDARDAMVAFLYLEPEDARLPTAWAAGGIRSLDREIARSAVEHMASTPDGARSAAAAWRSWAGALAERVIGESPGPPPISPVIRRILGLLHDPADDRPSLAALAAAAGLSPSRLMHLFRQQVGLPMRAYIRWRRLARAANELAAGATLTEAAHVAGFADSAHLSRTFRTTFGGAPSGVFRAARLVCAIEERGRVSPPP